MVNLKKQIQEPEKISAEIDEDFISFVARIDAFIQEMCDLKNASCPAKKNKTDDDFIFNILMCILWGEFGLLIGLDIVMIIKAFSK